MNLSIRKLLWSFFLKENLPLPGIIFLMNLVLVDGVIVKVPSLRLASMTASRRSHKTIKEKEKIINKLRDGQQLLLKHL